MSRRRVWLLVGGMLALVSAGGIFFLIWLARIAPSYVASACGCTRSFFSVHKELFLVAAPLVLLAVLAPLRGIFRALGVYARTQRMQYRAAKKTFLSLAPNVRLFRSDAPDAFTAGVIRPITFVSSACWEALSVTGRLALLRHEEAHRIHRDPGLKFLCLIVRASIGWIPGVHAFLSAEEHYLELRADADAVRAVGRKAIQEAVNVFFGHAQRQGSASTPFVAFEDRAALSERLALLSHQRSVSIRRAGLSIALFVSLLAFSTRWASAQPGSQCVALRPVCVATLPTSTRMPPSASTPASFPNP
ncbi:hypothetical protein KBD18_01325 [Patescibacteria group bacterium]|nr:hypothetical protein [Patescibacteria group bacterium]